MMNFTSDIIRLVKKLRIVKDKKTSELMFMSFIRFMVVPSLNKVDTKPSEIIAFHPSFKELIVATLVLAYSKH